LFAVEYYVDYELKSLLFIMKRFMIFYEADIKKMKLEA